MRGKIVEELKVGEFDARREQVWQKPAVDMGRKPRAFVFEVIQSVA
jgi:hypothetical protein